MNIGSTWESGESNVVEERWEQLLCTNHAAHWPVTVIQLTAPLCCRDAAGNIRSLNPPVHLERQFLTCKGQFAVQLGGLGRKGLNLQACAFNTQGISHLLHPGVQSQMGLLSEDFSLSTADSDSKHLLHAHCSRRDRKTETCMM